MHLLTWWQDYHLVSYLFPQYQLIMCCQPPILQQPTILNYNSKPSLKTSSISILHCSSFSLAVTQEIVVTFLRLLAPELALKLLLDNGFKLFSFQFIKLVISFYDCYLLSLPPTLKIHCLDWVIYAPAAFLGSGSHFSCSLSGIKPSFSVTRHHHRNPLRYRPKLIGQKFDRFSIQKSRFYSLLLFYMLCLKYYHSSFCLNFFGYSFCC